MADCGCDCDCGGMSDGGDIQGRSLRAKFAGRSIIVFLVLWIAGSVTSGSNGVSECLFGVMVAGPVLVYFLTPKDRDADPVAAEDDAVGTASLFVHMPP